MKTKVGKRRANFIDPGMGYRSHADAVKELIRLNPHQQREIEDFAANQQESISLGGYADHQAISDLWSKFGPSSPRSKAPASNKGPNGKRISR
jgi:hypothetical protein